MMDNLQELAEIMALEELPTDPIERLEALRVLAHGENYTIAECPECGQYLGRIDPIAHADAHFPRALPRAALDAEATARERALYRLAGKTPPERF